MITSFGGCISGSISYLAPLLLIDVLICFERESKSMLAIYCHQQLKAYAPACTALLAHCPKCQSHSRIEAHVPDALAWVQPQHSEECSCVQSFLFSSVGKRSGYSLFSFRFVMKWCGFVVCGRCRSMRGLWGLSEYCAQRIIARWCCNAYHILIDLEKRGCGICIGLLLLCLASHFSNLNSLSSHRYLELHSHTLSSTPPLITLIRE